MTYGDGSKERVIGIGKIEYMGKPSLDDFLFVEGLKVNFTNSECLITNENNEVIMKGKRSKDNCYLWSSEEAECSATCMRAKKAGKGGYEVKTNVVCLKSCTRCQDIIL